MNKLQFFDLQVNDDVVPKKIQVIINIVFISHLYVLEINSSNAKKMFSI